MTTIHAILPSVFVAGDAVPVDFRADIRKRLDKLDKSVYWLSEQLPAIGRTTIYEFLAEKNPREIGSDKLQAILNVLEKAERQKP